nr:MAG TPA: tail protein [Caudoviricetes sp.]
MAHIRRNPDDKIVYGYEKREIIGFADDLSTINGLILQLKYLIESDDSETRDRKTVQGTINVLNDIINIFEDLTPGEFLICDD